MVDPAKVLGFLDVAGAWDPTLAFVMAGALIVMAPATWWSRRLARPVLAEAFDRPAKTAIDARLVGGALLFGTGWGLVGFCPGPAIASLAYGLAPSLVPFLILQDTLLLIKHFPLSLITLLSPEEQELLPASWN